MYTVFLHLPYNCCIVGNWSTRYAFFIETQTLYLEVEERRESLPGTLQNMSVGRADISMFSFMLISRLEKEKGISNLIK